MNIGKAIKLCRTRRGLSQAKLAALATCSVSYLSLLENSQRDPTLSTIEKIAFSLNVPIGILFFLGAEKNELSGFDKQLAGQLAVTALEFLSEEHQPSLL
jgi:transcriptional regulator with XRE-family HTH domain